MKVVFPAALSGIIASFLLAIARCVGETMIVALAAGGSVVPLHHMTNPPMVVHQWHEAGTRDGSSSLQVVATGQRWTSPALALGQEEKVDALELTILPGKTTAKVLDVWFEDAAGGKRVTGELSIAAAGAASSAPIHVAWELPSTELSSSEQPRDEARNNGVRVNRGQYVLAFSPRDGDVELAHVEVDGERFIGLAERAAIPFDVRKSMQPMTGYLVQIFLGDVSNLGVEYYSSYAVAGVLFIITFGLTVVGHLIRVRFQQQYE